MYSAIQNALSNIQMQIGSATQKQMGLFTPLDVFIGVKAYIGEQECMSPIFNLTWVPNAK